MIFDEFTRVRLAPLLGFATMLCIDAGLAVENPAHVEDHAAGHADRDALFRRLVRLPARQPVVIVLRYYGELTDAEIAQELGCAVSTVRSIASRAVSALRLQMSAARIVALREV